MRDRPAHEQHNVRQAVVVALLGGLIAAGLLIMGTALSDSQGHGGTTGWLTTTGKIIGLGPGYQLGGAPIIAFTDRAGQRLVFQAKTHIGVTAVGSTASVAYNPRDPYHSFDITSTARLWPIHFAIGLLLAAAGGLGLWRVVSLQRLRNAFPPPPA